MLNDSEENSTKNLDAILKHLVLQYKKEGKTLTYNLSDSNQVKKKVKYVNRSMQTDIVAKE